MSPSRLPELSDATDAPPALIVQFCGSRCARRSSCAELAALQGQRGGETFAQLTGAEASGTSSAEMVLAGRRVTVEMARHCIGACSRDPAARVMEHGDMPRARYFKADSKEAVEAAVAAYPTSAEPDGPAAAE